MGDEMGDLRRAVEELHESDRLLDLILIRLQREGAPEALCEQARSLLAAYNEWRDP